MKKIILCTLLLSLFFNLFCFAEQNKKEIKKVIKVYEKNLKYDNIIICIVYIRLNEKYHLCQRLSY